MRSWLSENETLGGQARGGSSQVSLSGDTDRRCSPETDEKQQLEVLKVAVYWAGEKEPRGVQLFGCIKWVSHIARNGNAK